MKHLHSFFAVLLAAAVCAAVVLFSGCGASVQVQQLTIPGERGSIHATLTTPANAENMPAVVICHGFTGNRQLDGHAKPLAKTLAQHGIASIAIDFAGSGESEEPFTAYTPANMRDDITSAITYLTDTVGADPERIGLLGHSMGGRAVSVYLKDSIKAAALWAPADNTGLDGLEFLDHSAEGRQAIYDGAIQNGVLDLPKWGVTISADFVQQVADQDPTASLRTYNGPLLLAYTAGDAELLSQTTIDLTRQAAAEHSGPLVDLTGQYEDATHNFTAASGKKSTISPSAAASNPPPQNFLKNIYNPSLFAAAPPGRGIFYDNFKVHGTEKPCHISLNKISFLGPSGTSRMPSPTYIFMIHHKFILLHSPRTGGVR